MSNPENPTPSYIRIGSRRIRVPRRKSVRVGMALTLIISGILPTPPGPVFTVPMGLAILSIDYPRLRRFRRKAIVRLGRRRRARKSATVLGAPANVSL
ncbi:MAG: hypothetical protein ACPW61_11615 [Methyloligella sp. ZOD6]